MNILITGGAGFIGSHLADKLINSNNQIIVYDNLSTGTLSNLKYCFTKKNFKFFQGDIRDKTRLKKIVQNVDMIFHFAAAVGVKQIIENPIDAIDINITGTHNLLELCNKKQIRIIIASSSEVYGKSKKIPFNEEDDIVFGSTKHMRWHYACSKMIDEYLALAYYQKYKLDITIIRLFNTIGCRQSGEYGMVVPRFIKNAIINKDLEIYGDGNQSRCFIDVDDAINAVIELACSLKTSGEVINVGTNSPITINKLADKIIALTKSKSKKRYIPLEQIYGKEFEDLNVRIPDIKKLQQIILFKPKISIDMTLNKIINFMKK